MKVKKIRNVRRLFIGILWAALLLLAGYTTAYASSKNDESSAAYKARNGVVRIAVLDDAKMQLLQTGSGFGVGRVGKETDIFVTNWHVIVDEYNRVLSEIYILLDNDAIVSSYDGLDVNFNHMVHCKVLGSPQEFPDFAILKADKKVEGREALPLLSPSRVKQMDKVYALGYPGSADALNGGKYMNADVDDVYPTEGTITRLGSVPDFGNTDLVAHTCEINHGNSGGPLITTDGAVIGINTYGYYVDGSLFYCSVYSDYVMDELDRLNISYDVYTPSLKLPDWLIPIILIGAGLIIVVVLVVIFYRRREKKKDEQYKKDFEKLQAAMAQVQVEAAVAKKEMEATRFGLLGGVKPDPHAFESTASYDAKDTGFRIQVLSGEYAGRRFALGARTRFGREGSKNELVFSKNAEGVSRCQCELIVKGYRIYLRDTGSSYGTYLMIQNQGRKLKPHQATEIHVGDIFCFGKQKFRIDYRKK